MLMPESGPVLYHAKVLLYRCNGVGTWPLESVIFGNLGTIIAPYAILTNFS